MNFKAPPSPVHNIGRRTHDDVKAETAILSSIVSLGLQDVSDVSRSNEPSRRRVDETGELLASTTLSENRPQTARKTSAIASVEEDSVTSVTTDVGIDRLPAEIWHSIFANEALSALATLVRTFRMDPEQTLTR